MALAADRGQIVPSLKEEVAAGRTSEGEPTPAQRRHRLAWAVLLARVFDVTVSLTPDCGGPMKIVAVLTASDTLSILTLYPAYGAPRSAERLVAASATGKVPTRHNPYRVLGSCR